MEQGEATTLADVGDPVTGVAHYSLCVYDGSGAAQPIASTAAVAQTQCGDAPCWKRAGTKGVRYNDKTGRLSGATKVQLTAGTAGKAKASVRAKGRLLGGATLPATMPVVVQLIVNEQDRQGCWEATFSSFQASDSEELRATSD